VFNALYCLSVIVALTGLISSASVTNMPVCIFQEIMKKVFKRQVRVVLVSRSIWCPETFPVDMCLFESQI